MLAHLLLNFIYIFVFKGKYCSGFDAAMNAIQARMATLHHAGQYTRKPCVANHAAATRPPGVMQIGNRIVDASGAYPHVFANGLCNYERTGTVR